MREIKFRAWGRYGQWDEDGEKRKWEMVDGDDLAIEDFRPLCELLKDKEDEEYFMQYTGLKDKNGKEIYEGDIFRIEEDGDDEDLTFYVVIVWVQEWCMFATLRVEDEYQSYLRDGIKALDEPLFWTYTLEDTNSRKHFLCGNIYEHKHLLE